MPLDPGLPGATDRIDWEGGQHAIVFLGTCSDAARRRDADAISVMTAIQIPESIERVVVEVVDPSLDRVLSGRLGGRVEVFPKEAVDAELIAHALVGEPGVSRLLGRLAGVG